MTPTLRELARMVKRIGRREDLPMFEGAELIRAAYVLEQIAYRDDQKLSNEFERESAPGVLN